LLGQQAEPVLRLVFRSPDFDDLENSASTSLRLPRPIDRRSFQQDSFRGRDIKAATPIAQHLLFRPEV